MRMIFGNKNEQYTYHLRIGIYVIIPKTSQADEILILQAPNGAFLLPGGEIEKAETRMAALNRELIEEFGVKIAQPNYVGQAAEYFYSTFRKTAFYNPGYFYATTHSHQIQAPLEAFNKRWWLPVDEALAKLKRPTHRWAVTQWQQLKTHI